MGVHIQYPDGTRQWIRNVKDRYQEIDRSWTVLAFAPDEMVLEWRRYRPSSSLSPCLNWAIYCDDD